MSTLYYTVDVQDDVVHETYENLSQAFTRRESLSQEISVASGSVTVDLSNFTTVKAVLIKTAGVLTATINGRDVEINSLLFMVIEDLTSLVLATDVVTAFAVDVFVWGT